MKEIDTDGVDWDENEREIAKRKGKSDSLFWLCEAFLRIRRIMVRIFSGKWNGKMLDSAREPGEGVW